MNSARPTALYLAFFLGTGCVRTTGPADGKIVARVIIDGNHEVSDDALVSGLETRPPRGWIRRKRVRVDLHAIDADIRRIKTFYQSKGFFATSVTGPTLRPLDKESTEVHFAVDEGPPTLIDSVTITGAPLAQDATEEVLRARLLSRPGERFDYDHFLASKDALLHCLIERGFAYAEVKGSVSVNTQRREADIALAVDAGPRSRFGETSVSGLQRVPRSAIMNRLTWTPGALFDSNKLAQTKARLYALGIFSSVRVDFDHEARSATVPMRVTVVEAPRQAIRLGGGAGLDPVRWELRGRAGYHLVGPFGRPMALLSLELRPAYAFIRGIGGEQGFVGTAWSEIKERDLWWPLLVGSVATSYTVEEIEAYTGRGPKVQVGLARPFFEDRLELSLGYKIEFLNFTRVSDAVDPVSADDLALRSPYRVAFVEQRLTYDRRDSPIEPRRGSFAELVVETSTRGLGSKVYYSAVTPEVRGYLSLGARITLAARARLGALLAGSALPISRRYFGGGANDHRGFAQRRLSPTLSSADETVGIGGSAFWLSSVESRVNMVQIFGSWLAAAAFVDAGDYRLTFDELELTHPHVAVGGGLRYRTPVGPLRIDLGVRANRRGIGEPDPSRNWVFHFSLGEPF